MDMTEVIQRFGETVTVIFGFTILFLVMKKYAWPVILDTIDARQKEIADGFSEIENLKNEAAESLRKYQEEIKGIEETRRQMLQEGVDDGKKIGVELVEKARAEIAVEAAKAKQHIKLELATARKQLREDVIDLTVKATEHILEQKLTDEADRELIGSFIGSIEELN